MTFIDEHMQIASVIESNSKIIVNISPFLLLQFKWNEKALSYIRYPYKW